MRREKEIRCALLLLTIWLVFSGCGAKDPAGTPREVSAEFVSFGQSGLLVKEGERKESGASFEDVPVKFQDPVMEQMLRSVVEKPEGDVLPSDLAKIHALYWRLGIFFSDLQSPDGTCREGEVVTWEAVGQPESLADLALCPNLQWLELCQIEVPSLAPLASLPQLETIQFLNTRLSGERLEELALLPSLTGLEMDLRDIQAPGEPLVSDDPTTDGSFLLPLAQRLKHLEISGDLRWAGAVLSRMEALEELGITAPKELDFLKEIPNLRKLYIIKGKHKDWSALGEVTSLEQLHLVMCEGVRLEDLRSLTNLKYLDLTATSLTPLRDSTREKILQALPGLEGLHTGV